jgi:TBC1 domain family protein 5
VQQDVERTFPDIPFFQLPHVQKELTIILFLHAQLNKQVGYRQGMHEIAACLYMTLHFDSQAPLEGNSTPKELEEFCSKEHVAADTSYLLSILLSPRSQLGRWFEWRDPSESASAPVISGPTIPYVAPIAQTCNYLQNVLLKSIDPVLHSSLRDNNVEATIYGMSVLIQQLLELYLSVHQIAGGLDCSSPVNSRSTNLCYYGTQCLPLIPPWR